jgi:hypothetical protein
MAPNGIPRVAMREGDWKQSSPARPVADFELYDLSKGPQGKQRTWRRRSRSVAAMKGKAHFMPAEIEAEGPDCGSG